MEIIFLILGIVLAGLTMKEPNSIKENIALKSLGIVGGLGSIYYVNPSYLKLNAQAIILGLAIGSIFLMLHLVIGKGIKLKRNDINKGLIKTCLLIYIIELPAEEFIYRGMLFITLLNIMNPLVAIIITSLFFLVLHIKTWKNKFVWFGSLILALVCSTLVYSIKSIWVAIIIHNLNDFGFLTLVNRRNIFTNTN